MEHGTTYIVLTELAGNPPPHLGVLQEFLLMHADVCIIMWRVAWFVTAVILFLILVRQYFQRR